MLRLIGDCYAYVCGWPTFARLHKALFYLSARALGLHNYQSPAVSGERWLVRKYLTDIAAPIVFDIGANNGDWLAAVRLINGRAQVYAFEPQVALATHISATHRDVTVINAAVSDTSGFFDLYDYADHPGSQHASLLDGAIDAVHGGTPRHTTVPVTTIDAYCNEHNISHIDLLKIDVEGYELQVLRGAQRMLEEGGIDVIQFEVTHLNVLGRVFLNDFVKCLGSHYRLYRLLPHGTMHLQSQNHWFNEQFGYQNIVALKNA